VHQIGPTVGEPMRTTLHELARRAAADVHLSIGAPDFGFTTRSRGAPGEAPTDPLSCPVELNR